MPPATPKGDDPAVFAGIAASDQIATQIQDAVQDVLSKLEGADRNAADFVEGLVSAVGEVPDDIAPRAIRVLVQSILDETHQMIGTNRLLREQLNSSSEHICTLSAELGEVRRKASTDALTAVGNRAYFDRCLLQELEIAGERGLPLSLILLDIDHFKRFNDSYGHLIGDQVLRKVARALRQSVKGQDTLARFGGEEFAIILPNTKCDDAAKLAENLRRTIGSRTIKSQSTGASFGAITVSLGVAQYRPDEPAEALIERADAAMYAAKHNGRNCVMLEDPTTTGAA